MTVSAPQEKLCTGSEREWSQMSTAAPAVANCGRSQWWSMPRKANLPLNSSTGLESSWMGPPSKGAKGTCGGGGGGGSCGTGGGRGRNGAQLLGRPAGPQKERELILLVSQRSCSRWPARLPLVLL